MSTVSATPSAPPAAPPTRKEIERKLSFKSAFPPRQQGESSKKQRKPSIGSIPMPNAMSGNESDTSSVASSHPAPSQTPSMPANHPASPMMSPGTPSVGGLSSIAERKFRGSSMGVGELLDEEVELEDDDEGEGTDEDFGEGEQGVGASTGELARGMEGERVVKSGFLWKKQERRKAWKKRWFVLRTVKLAYYKDEKEYSLCRLLDLHTVHTVAPVTVKKNPFSFGIVTSKRTFFAKASSQDEMEEWVRAINGVRRRLGEREEEARGQKEKESSIQGAARPVTIPGRDGSGSEPHQGTYTSTLSSSTMSTAQSGPTGYFGSRSPSTPSAASMQASASLPGNVIPPSSPLATTNSLTSQLAKVSLPSQPLSLNTLPRYPANPPLASPRAGSTNRGLKLVPSSSSRRDPSTSSVSSDYFPQTPTISGQGHQIPPTPGYAASSDEDEAYFSDPNTAFPEQSVSQSQVMSPSLNQAGGQNGTVDPKKVILSAYLMKRSKGRGRKVWRKRWFLLTSQGLTYTKSHMDARALRYIPLTSILDALDFTSSDEGSSSDHSRDRERERERGNASTPLAHPRSRLPSSAQTPVPANINPVSVTTSTSHAHSHPRKGSHQSTENTFRLITSKRTFVLCAPSEEDEIKWLAAFKALLNRERGGSIASPSQGSTVPLSPTFGTAQNGIQRSASIGINTHIAVPTIVQQPPTPATLPPTPVSPISPADKTQTQGPPVLGPPAAIPSRPISDSGTKKITLEAGRQGDGVSVSLGTIGRGRSATQTAKSAVADVVRRFHPENPS